MYLCSVKVLYRMMLVFVVLESIIEVSLMCEEVTSVGSDTEYH